MGSSHSQVEACPVRKLARNAFASAVRALNNACYTSVLSSAIGMVRMGSPAIAR
jgi:hypothetical protein